MKSTKKTLKNIKKRLDVGRCGGLAKAVGWNVKGSETCFKAYSRLGLICFCRLVTFLWKTFFLWFSEFRSKEGPGINKNWASSVMKCGPWAATRLALAAPGRMISSEIGYLSCLLGSELGKRPMQPSAGLSCTVHQTVFWFCTVHQTTFYSVWFACRFSTNVELLLDLVRDVGRLALQTLALWGVCCSLLFVFLPMPNTDCWDEKFDTENFQFEQFLSLSLGGRGEGVGTNSGTKTARNGTLNNTNAH